MASVLTAPMLERGDSVPEPTADVGRDLEFVQPPSDHGEDFMNRFTTMALAAGTLALATGSVAQAEMVEFNYTWYGEAPGNIDVTEWGMSHITDVSVAPNGDFSGPDVPTLNLYLDIGGVLNPVEIASFHIFFTGDFEVTMDLSNVLNYGPMDIEIIGQGDWEPSGGWSGELQITWGPGGNPFAGTVTQNGIWSAQVVPAPGVVALFGLAGLTGRRRRD